MDALKKAEAAKHAGGAESAASELRIMPDAELTSVDTTPPEPPRSPLPDLAAHGNVIDDQLAAAGSSPARRGMANPPPHPGNAAGAGPAPDAQAHQLAASQLFSAKQAPRPALSRWGLILGLAAAAALGIGGWFWWQLQGSRLFPRTTSLIAKPRPPVTAPPVLAAADPVPALVPEKIAVSPPPPSPPVPPSATTATRQSQSAPPPAASLSRTPQRESRESTTAAPALHFEKNQTPTLPRLEQAYDALQAGRQEDAQRLYEQVLHSDPRNVDALLGLATLAVLQGQPEQAQSYYLQVLETDPDDASAQAGLIGLKGQSDPQLSESRLKTALSRQPQSAALHFALGNLYARGQRWSEAQQAYFKAFSCEADNPDYLFNLAVSLDHLRQPRLAAQYYQQALNAARGLSSISFDRQQLETRLAELQP